MTEVPRHPQLVPALPLEPVPPRWVTDWLIDDGGHEHGGASPSSGHVTSTRTGRFTLLSVAIEQAGGLAGRGFSDAVTRAYSLVLEELTQQRRQALRIWNFIPGIQAPTSEGQDRYMAFNAGRFAAYSDWLGTPNLFAGRLPTASAVGVSGNTLWIYVLGGASAGTSVENPRQCPSQDYSLRYGARPPLFARAVVCPAMSRVLIGGTASIVGETSEHLGDVHGQTRETLRNIGALIESATQCSPGQALGLLRDVRVHVREPQDANVVRGLLATDAPHLRRMEFVQAELCRKELLVEIEGVAVVPPDRSEGI